MNIEWRKINDIKPYENNPRVNDAAVDAVAKSIQKFGWRQPIVVDKDAWSVRERPRQPAGLPGQVFARVPCRRLFVFVKEEQAQCEEVRHVGPTAK
jgi:ParB-like nuclease domain